MKPCLDSAHKDRLCSPLLLYARFLGCPTAEWVRAHIPRLGAPAYLPYIANLTALSRVYQNMMMASEKAMTKGDWSPEEVGSTDLPDYGLQLDHNRSWTTRFADSFKRDPNAHATPKGSVGADGRVFDVESAAANTATSPLQRHLKGRHLQMIAIGGSIGTGLVGSIDRCRSSSRHRLMNTAVCRKRQRSGKRRPGFLDHRLWPHRHNVVLHRSRTR